MKRVVIAGGSGFLGQSLKHFLEAQHWSVDILARRRIDDTTIIWDGKSAGPWMESLEGADVLINLAGRSVNCRYHQRQREDILRSRIEATEILGTAIRQCQNPPPHWLNASTATIYQDTRGDLPANDEVSGKIGNDFSMGVAQAWEKSFFESDVPNTLQTAMRISIVLGATGGAFPVMASLARWGLCSSQGSGEQWISWIHVDDFCRAVSYLIENQVTGCINVTAPSPDQEQEF